MAAQNMKFSFKDLVTFTEVILNGKIHFSCSGFPEIDQTNFFSFFKNATTNNHFSKREGNIFYQLISISSMCSCIDLDLSENI